jgi:regulator of sirC expression with transglutaminase-like and TPR domain
MPALDLTTFATEVSEAGDDLSPVRAGLLFARECAYPDLHPSDYLARLDALVEEARPVLSGAGSDAERGLALSAYLFETAGFRGNSAEYADARNSYLNQVLERRLGLPISLSVIYLEVGRQLGLAVDGVGLPGHFIVSLAGEDGPILIDPFHAGRRLSHADCMALAQSAMGPGVAFDQGWLAPTGARDIVARMLNNLRGFYISVEDWPLAIRIVEHLRQLQPRDDRHLRDLGLLHYRNGAYRRASRLLNDYVLRNPSAPDLEAVRRGRDRMLEQLARLN